MTFHIARAVDNTEIESDCGCNLAPCGLVIDDSDTIGCGEHSYLASKTMRQVHSAENCPERRD